MDAETEIRHLLPRDLRYFIEMLDSGDHWKQLASILPKPDCKPGYLMTSQMIQLLESHSRQINGSPTRALLDYWGTYGRKRPTIKNLITNLISCKLYQAADYVSIKILNEGPVIRDSDKLDIPLSIEKSEHLRNEVKCENEQIESNQVSTLIVNC